MHGLGVEVEGLMLMMLMLITPRFTKLKVDIDKVDD